MSAAEIALAELRARIDTPCECRPGRVCRRCEVCYPRMHLPPGAERDIAVAAVRAHNAARSA